MRIVARILASVFVIGTTSCEAPPPELNNSGAAPAPAGGPSTPPTDGVVWNGEGVGSSAKGWADCDKKPDCKAAVTPEPGAGKDGSTALKFHGEGPGFLGMGWNWFGWYPENGGTDVSGYTTLTFWTKIQAKSSELAPDPAGTNVSLGCSKGKKGSLDAPFSKYAKGSLDGGWHQVKIPIADITKGKGAEFDRQTAWEFRLSTWSGSAKSFEIYVDDIAFEK